MGENFDHYMHTAIMNSVDAIKIIQIRASVLIRRLNKEKFYIHIYYNPPPYVMMEYRYDVDVF